MTGTTARIAAIGDIAISPSLKSYGTDLPVIAESVLDSLNNANAVIGNFEFALSDQKVAYHAFARQDITADRELIQDLRRIDELILTLANNHMMDWGREGLLSTISALDEINAHYVGAGENVHRASTPHTFVINGIRFSLIAAAKPFCAATEHEPGIRAIDEEYLCNDVRELKRKGSDHVIVALHWGVEYSRYPSPADQKLAHDLIKSGATLILGHHPHTLQGIESTESGLIAFSLGNFVMDMNLDDPPDEDSWQQAHRSMILEVNFAKTGIESYRVVPIEINEQMRTVLPDNDKCTEIRDNVRYLSETISEQSFYSQAYSNLRNRSKNAWRKKIENHGVRAVFLFFKTLKSRHVKMIALHYYYRIKQLIYRA